MADILIDDSDFKFGIDPKKLTDKVGNLLATRLQNLLRERLLASGLKRRTGQLQDTLTVRYVASTDSIEVGVMVYGIFNSYGVGPAVKRGKIFRIDDWVKASLEGEPQGGNTFSYNPQYRRYGIPARKWIPGEEAVQRIVNDILNEISQNTNSIPQ